MNSHHRNYIRKANKWDVKEASIRLGVTRRTIISDSNPTLRSTEEVDVFSYIECNMACTPGNVIDYCLKRKILGMSERPSYQKKNRVDQMLRALEEMGVKIADIYQDHVDISRADDPNDFEEKMMQQIKSDAKKELLHEAYESISNIMKDNMDHGVKISDQEQVRPYEPRRACSLVAPWSCLVQAV